MELNLTGTYPIILDGEKTGEIKVIRDGLFWRFEANNEMRDELLRLSVYGDGLEGYVGLMEPSGEELVLVKKLSRSALSGFPKSISYASRKGEDVLSHQAQEDENSNQEDMSPTCETGAATPLVDENCTCSSPDSPLDENKPPPDAPVSPPIACEWIPCACPCSLFSGIEAKSITSSINGAMMQQGKDEVLLAIPDGAASLLPKTDFMKFIEKKDIYGFSYRVYRV